VLPVALAAGDAEAFEKLVVEADGKSPFSADLRTQTVTAPGGRQFKFDIAPEDRTILLEGLDDIGLTLKHAPDIAAWEQRMQRERPWLQSLSRT